MDIKRKKPPVDVIELDRLFPYLFKSSGIDFSVYKAPTLKRAIQKRLRAAKLQDTSEYIQYLRSHPNEIDALAQSMLIRVTGFFRDPEVFKTLRRKALPALLGRKNGPVRIWVPGCCTGEEVYSLAIACLDFIDGKNTPVQIFGTDLNEECLSRARTGIYQRRDLKGLSRSQIDRHFVLVNGHYEISKTIRGMCTFAKQNVIQDPPFSKVDLISCRNVLIYLKPEIQDKILKIFHYALNGEGTLLLGKSENIGVLYPALFHAIDKSHSLYGKRQAAMTFDHSFRFHPPSYKAEPAQQKVQAPYEFDVNREMDRVLIERTGHAAVLVNEAGEVIQTKGSVASFFRLPTGRMSYNLTKIAHDDLSVELKMLLQKAHKSSEILCKTIQTERGTIEVEVIPLHRSLLKEKFFLVLLAPPKPMESSVSGNHKPDKRIIALQQELAATKAWMQSLIEEHEQNIQELKSSNEEVLSSNEELQSLNEELQTAKEELESTNEELTTVNEQYHAQMEQLRLSEERFRILVELVRDYAIFMLDPRGNIVTWNQGAERLNGYNANEAIGSNIAMFYPPEQKNHPKKELRIASKEGVYREDGWRLRKDGTLFWAHVVITALRDKAGKLRGFAKVTQDRTAQRKAEELLRQSEERFRLIVEAVEEYAIFMLDPQGRILTWNAGAKRLKGYEASEITGQHISKFYIPEERKANRPQKLLNYAVKHGRAIDEGWRMRKDGTRFWANVTITALKDKQGRLRGFSKVTRDMSERRRKEQELLNAYLALEERVKERTKELRLYSEELARSNADLQQFAYIASHDLQEPLRIVSVYVDLLRRQLKDNPDEKIQMYFEYLQEGAVRAQRLIRELLEYSRIGTQGAAFVPVSMEIVIKHVLSLMDLAIKESHAKVTYDDLPVVPVDRFQMEQLFQNLISNAIKYKTEDDPIIHISAQRDGDFWVFRVQDNGIGIDPQYHELIFTVFKRLHSSKDYPGTGIGLALAKKIVERHGGRIRVESSLGKGAAFIFSLPLKQKPKADTDSRL